MHGWFLLALVLVVGVAFGAGDPAPLVWKGATEIASGGGERGPWRQNNSHYDFVDDPAVAIDERGNVLVAWVDQSRKDVVFQRIESDGTRRPEAPVNVSRSSDTFSWLPRVALAPGAPQTVYVAWQEIIFSGGSHGGDVFFARSDDGGATFGAPINLSNSIGGDGKGRINRRIWDNGSLDVAAGADGAVYVAWTEYHGLLWLSRSTDGGRRFEKPRQLAGDDRRPARAPSLAVGADRTVFLAWTVGEDDTADVRVARSHDGGVSFGRPRVAARTAGYSDAPSIAIDRRGTLHLAFSDSAGGPFERAQILYARSSDGGRNFDPPRVLSATEPYAAGSRFPALVVDGTGDVFVVWERFDGGDRRPRGLGITMSRDGGQRFSPAVVVPQSADPSGAPNGSSQGLLMRKLAVNSGRLAIVNSSLRRGDSRVWLIRGDVAR